MMKATVAIEDKRFWQHGGIDPIGITRAFWADVSQGKVVQGGSTITQQLVRNLYISRERTFTRKLREACLAVKLAQSWPKQKILTAYLNQIYYGSQAYGVEAAAQTYFSKSAKRLTLAQAALLAGLPQAPSRFDPFANPTAARIRRKQVLRAMLSTGAISKRQYRKVVSHHDLHLKPGALYKKIRQPYFFSYVRDELVRVYGEARVRHGGLRVYTTIDPRLQSAARKAIKDTLYLSNDPAAAVVAIDPATGAIRAMTAVSPGRANNQFNLIADARRQPGSTFKAFVLATAIEEGMNPASTYYLSAPLHCDKKPVRAQAVGRRDVRRLLLRQRVGRTRHASVGQHRLRAIDPRRRRRQGREDGDAAGRADADASEGVLLPLSRASARSRSRRSTWRPRTRRWRPAASTRSRWRSRR